MSVQTHPKLVPSRFVQTSITYSSPKPGTPADEKWFRDIRDWGHTNVGTTDFTTAVYDVRGQEALTHIDTTGFQMITSPSNVSAELLLNASNEEVAKAYYPEVEALLLKQTGASRVIFFDHTVRKPHPDDVPDTPDTRRPILTAHVDQTPVSAHNRVDRHDKPPRPWRRFQLINVWRPILNTVYDYPLAVMEFDSLDIVDDLVTTTLMYAPPTPDGETYSLLHTKNHRWWYWSEMTPNDVILLKCYDSASRALTTVKASRAEVKEDELRDVAGMTPHTAFLDAEGAKKGIKRHSIEVRALVFYD